jgi:hypothetical protein
VFTLGSDSRCLKDVFSNDGAGNYCWIKADPTFEGLKQVVFEKERVFIGDEPPILSAVRNRPTKFIRSLTIDKVGTYDQSQGVWFDKTEFVLSPELFLKSPLTSFLNEKSIAMRQNYCENMTTV